MSVWLPIRLQYKKKGKQNAAGRVFSFTQYHAGRL